MKLILFLILMLGCSTTSKNKLSKDINSEFETIINKDDDSDDDDDDDENTPSILVIIGELHALIEEKEQEEEEVEEMDKEGKEEEKDEDDPVRIAGETIASLPHTPPHTITFVEIASTSEIVSTIASIAQPSPVTS